MGGGSRSQAGSGTPQPFAFTPEYTPANGIRRFVCGTPPVLSMAALEFGVDTVLVREQVAAASAAIRDKSIALTELFMALVDERSRSRLHDRHAARSREARQPGVAFSCRRRLRDHAGADRARRHRRLPARPTSCASASPRSTRALPTCGMPSIACRK